MKFNEVKMMLTVDYGQCGGPLHVVNSREEWCLADPASWLVTVKENLLVASILSFSKLAPSSPNNMTSQAKTSFMAVSASVPSTASPAVAIPQFITSLVQSTVQANTTFLLSQLDRRIAAVLKAQGAVSNAPGQEIQQPAQHQAPPPITSAPVAPVSTTPSQNVPGEHACGDSSVRYNIDGEISAQFQVMPAAAGSEELRASKPSVAANETCINGSIYLTHPGIGAMAPACSLANMALFTPNSSTVPVQGMSHSSMSLLNPTVTTANAPTVAMEAANKLPVLISPNASPIPFETCERIWKGQYVDRQNSCPKHAPKCRMKKIRTGTRER